MHAWSLVRRRPLERAGGFYAALASRARRIAVVGTVVGLVVLVAFVVGMALHRPYAGSSPSVRVSVAGGCPADLAAASDVRTPGGPGFFSRLFHYPPLAPSGASSGLICDYGGPVSAPPAAASRPLQQQVRLTATQAGALSRAANQVSTRRPAGESKCPSDVGTVVIVVLGYLHHPDVDIWWNDSGCETADNGYVQVFQAGNASFGTFGGAVATYLPPAR
jgi:hypothetical protein